MTHKQVILFGAPGTGKSFRIKEEFTHGVPDNKIFRVTIHPEFTYSDFVGQLLPYADSANNPKFKFQPGPFTKALDEAFKDSSKDVFLILEELSRGNVAAIFGDLFQLLDRDKYFESEFPVYNENIAKILAQPSNTIKLPSNFNIICTVNTNDQNVFPMDTAFKRRFDWEYVSIDPAVDKQTNSYIKNLNNPLIKIRVSASPNHFETSWLSFYTALDDFITNKENGLGKNEDKQIGQFFIKFTNSEIADSNSNDQLAKMSALESIDYKIQSKLLRYLWEDVQGRNSFNNEISIFDKSISSFKDLFDKYQNQQIFSQEFLDNFLHDTPNEGRNKYPYN